MKIKKPELVINPINQLNLFGYEYYFNFFDKLFQKNNLPHSILLTGEKGLGKTTFVYHFINFLLSQSEENKYNKKDFSIDPNNSSYKLITHSTHSNLFILDAFDEENIKIEQIRKLILFLNKTTYNKGLKLVLIDNAEKLNINSSNALLKSIEEPSENTYFFIINNDSQKLLSTIKSRCINFNISLNFNEKKNIFNNIIGQYELNFSESDLNNFLYFDTHGNLIKYLNILKNSDYSLSDHLSCISYFMEVYSAKSDNKILNILAVFIQNYYYQLTIKNSSFINSYCINLNKILYLINNMKKFHIDKKNLIFSINKIIQNER